MKEMDFNKVNPFLEARQEAGYSIVDAAMLFGTVTEQTKARLYGLEVLMYPHPTPPWAHKYLSKLREIAFNVQIARRLSKP